MRKSNQRMKDKAWKTINEKKYQTMVKQYQEEKNKLTELKKDSVEYATQNKLCETLFNNAKVFFNQSQ